MLDKYDGVGLKKLYLIFGMCDESFSINCTVTPPDDVDRGWFMFFVTALNHIYWVIGATLGGLLGYLLVFDTEGIEFVMIALFTVMFIEQWEENANHIPALIGVIGTLACLLLLGSQNFMLPSMFAIIACFTFYKKLSDRKAGE